MLKRFGGSSAFGTGGSRTDRRERLNRVKFQEGAGFKYILVRLTDDDVAKWREAIAAGHGGEVMEVLSPREAKEGPWRIVA